MRGPFQSNVMILILLCRLGWLEITWVLGDEESKTCFIYRRLK